jgi:hypothetical protein
MRFDYEHILNIHDQRMEEKHEVRHVIIME